MDYTKIDYDNGYVDENGNFVYIKDYRKNFQRVAELKRNLAETDYRAIKYAEGQYTEEEYAPYKKQRQEWRAEINELEEKLKGEK